MIARRSLAIDPDWSAGDLHDALAPLGAELLQEALLDIDAALDAAQAQDESLVTHAPRLTKQQARLDWQKSAEVLAREVRAFNPWPVSHTSLDGDNLRVWQARAAPGVQRSRAPGQVVAARSGRGLRQLCRRRSTDHRASVWRTQTGERCGGAECARSERLPAWR